MALHKVCWDAHLHLAARRKQKDMELLIQKRTERLLGRGGDDSSVGSRSVGSFTLSTVTGVLSRRSCQSGAALCQVRGRVFLSLGA